VQQSQQRAGKELVPRQIHEEEMERMRLEVQQCKDFIQTQQQLLQVSKTHITTQGSLFKPSYKCL
jgi:hypothetical protein